MVSYTSAQVSPGDNTTHVTFTPLCEIYDDDTVEVSLLKLYSECIGMQRGPHLLGDNIHA